MAPTQIGENWIGESHEDLQIVLQLFSEQGEHPTDRFVDANCDCSSQSFFFVLDEESRCGIRTCSQCEQQQVIGTIPEGYAQESLNECDCFCGQDQFQFTAAFSLDSTRHFVTWIYIGLRCTACGTLGCYADWEMEGENFRELKAIL